LAPTAAHLALPYFKLALETGLVSLHGAFLTYEVLKKKKERKKKRKKSEYIGPQQGK